MKKLFNPYVLLVVLLTIVTAGLIGYTYWKDQQITAREYDNALIPYRNAVIESIDTLTADMNSADGSEKLDESIATTTQRLQELKNKVDTQEVQKNNNLKELNLKFIQTTENVLANANNYSETVKTGEDDNIQQIITDYNTGIDDLNSYNNQIESEV